MRKHERKRELRRPIRMWVNNTKMDRRGIGCDGVVKTGLLRLGMGPMGGRGSCEHRNEQWAFHKCWQVLE